MSDTNENQSSRKIPMLLTNNHPIILTSEGYFEFSPDEHEYQSHIERTIGVMFIFQYLFGVMSRTFVVQPNCHIKLFRLFYELIQLMGLEKTMALFKRFEYDEEGNMIPILDRPVLQRSLPGASSCPKHQFTFRITDNPHDESNYRIIIIYDELIQTDLYAGCPHCVQELKEAIMKEKQIRQRQKMCFLIQRTTKPVIDDPELQKIKNIYIFMRYSKGSDETKREILNYL